MRPYKINNIWIDLDEVVAITDPVLSGSKYKIAVLIRHGNDPYFIELSSDHETYEKEHEDLVNVWANKPR